MSDKTERCVVNVSTQTEALCEPTFIIKVQGKYYGTLAVWEYDPDAPDLTPEQRRDIEELARVYGEERARGEVYEAVKLRRSVICHFGSTNPPGGGGRS